MAKKKRKPGKPAGKQSKGLSGNPQRRAEQLRARDEAVTATATATTAPADDADTSGAARHRTWPWWAESHQAVLAQVRDTEWPDRLLDIETLAGRLAGEEFHARLNAPGPGTGMTPAGWLQTLTETALDAMSDDLAAEGKDWPRLWAFACGLADAEEIAAAASGFAALGITPAPAVPVPWYAPAGDGDVLVARDAYGDRFLLAAPFRDPGRPDAVDHWYAWDLDWCGNDMVVAGGAYDSADLALAEWRAAVGPAADGAGFSPCPLELGIRLLGPGQPGSGQAEGVAGDEPVELFREWARLSRRATVLSAVLSHRFRASRSGARADERGAAIDEFLDQHAGHAWNAPGDRDAAEDALDLILEFWGPVMPADERAFFACSPHRIETCALILRDSYEPDAANEALRLLPDWVQWCARHIGLGEEFTERAVAAARAEAATPAGGHHAIPRREGPFRRPE